MQLRSLNLSENLLVGTLPETWSNFTNVGLSQSEVDDTSHALQLPKAFRLVVSAKNGRLQGVTLAMLDSSTLMLMKPHFVLCTWLRSNSTLFVS